MKPNYLLTALIFTLFSLPVPTAHAALAGRVLVSVGDSVAVRDGKEIRLRYGSQVEDKDTLRTSAAGTLQVRFTDQSIIALREKSTFKLEKYVFLNQTGAKDTDANNSAVFNLLKGGFRTVTGLIGRTNRKNYSVRTAAATIGIRGTHYAVRVCESDCKNEDGSNAKDGVYGSVLSASDKDSRITVENKSGEKEYGRDEHFYVKDEKTPSEGLLVPPSFVADNLKGREQKKDDDSTDKGDDPQDQGKGRDTAESGADEDPRANMVEDTHETRVNVADPSCASGRCDTPPPLPVGGFLRTPTAAVLLAYAGVNVSNQSNLIYTATDNIILSPTTKTLDANGNLVAFNTAAGDSATHLNVDSVSTLTNNVVFDGTTGPAGDGYGRWDGGSITGTTSNIVNLPTTSFTPVSGIHVIYSAALTLPEVIEAKTGTVNFNHAGGTNPTDHFGNVGTFSASSSLNVDFDNNKALMNASWSIAPVSAAAINYSLINAPLTLFVDGSGAGVRAVLANDATATCSACSATTIGNISNNTIDSVNIQGNFSGTAGNTLGMAISTFDAGIGTASAIPVTSASVQVFREGAPVTNLTQ